MAATTNPIAGCRYLVDIGPLQRRSASKVAAVGRETPATPYNLGFSSQGQAGLPNVRQLPTIQQDVQKLSIDFAVEANDQSITKWYESVTQQGQQMDQQLTVTYFDSQNKPAKMTHYLNCFPTSHNIGEVSPAGQDYLIETVELTYETVKVDK